MPHTDFNPLHHEGGDLKQGAGVTDVEISIHSTTRVETVENVGDERKPIDFNPLHHEGGDGTAVKKYQYTTGFQSTPPRGWRRTKKVLVSQYRDFNPLHHEGGDSNTTQ